MLKKTKLFIFITTTLIFGSMLKVQAKCSCSEINSIVAADSSELLYRSDERYPQTVIHDIVTGFLADKNNDKDKKVLVLGYDGFREDALENVYDLSQSAVKEVSLAGGLYHSYAGANGKQETSTAPGWLSILNGSWAYNFGVIDNQGYKPEDTTTFLNDAITFGYTSTFIASWAPHFDITYREDIIHYDGKAVYQQMNDDNETLAMLHDIVEDTSPYSYDVVFATLEYTDHAGHSIGYGNQIEEYISASRNVDIESYKLLQSIRERTTIDDEDWLIILTTDHGGQSTGHGGQSDSEVNTWFAVNKDVEEYF